MTLTKLLAFKLALLVFAMPVALYTSIAQDRACYSGDTAYVIYSMNMRRTPSTDLPKIGVQQGGSAVTVIETVRATDYCWLRIGNSKWIAKTRRVSSRAPAGPAQSEIKCPR